jgi:nitroimidazol reductase NimA-like FMN-containing flavoprotein (pyridoxamine 5'-phosphate oxidase superfamily)
LKYPAAARLELVESLVDKSRCRVLYLPSNNDGVEMRRKEREITDRAVIENIIRQSSVCRLAMSEDNDPYIVPLCFGYKDNVLYFHTGRKGVKLRILEKNNRVCFEFDILREVVKSKEPCKWGMRYMSVIGFGTTSMIEDFESKRKALDIIMQHYSGKSFAYKEDAIHKAAIIQVEIEHMTGRKSNL